MPWMKNTRDTRWLDITGTILSGANHVSGRLLLRRRGDVVTIILDDLVVDRTGTATLATLPTGFRPVSTLRESWWQPGTAGTSSGGTLNISTSLVGYQLAAGSPMSARIEVDCVQAWPSTYPGIEVQL